MAKTSKTTTPEIQTTNGKLHPGTSHNVYMPFDKFWLKTRLEEIAKKENRSVSEISITFLEEGVERYARLNR